MSKSLETVRLELIAQCETVESGCEARSNGPEADILFTEIGEMAKRMSALLGWLRVPIPKG